jgi:hypothetical protein
MPWGIPFLLARAADRQAHLRRVGLSLQPLVMERF